VELTVMPNVDEHGMNMSRGLNDNERVCGTCGNRFKIHEKSIFFCKDCGKKTGIFNLS
jgi:predicted RNA-binding Zn-ribbon protein involved in translation (DUF1610 family)